MCKGCKVDKGKSFLPDGRTVLEPGDRAVVVTAGRTLLNLDDILL